MPMSHAQRWNASGRDLGGSHGLPFVEAPRRPLAPRTYPEIREGLLRRHRATWAGTALPQPSAALLASSATDSPRTSTTPSTRGSSATSRPAAAHLDRRRAARPVDQPGRRHRALVTDRNARRGGGRPLAVRPRRLRRRRVRRPDSGGAGHRMALTVARDIGLTHLLGLAHRGGRSRVRVYASDRPTSRSPGPWTSRLPSRHLAGHPSNSASSSRRRPFRQCRRGSRCGPCALVHRGRGRLDEHGLGRSSRRAGRTRGTRSLAARRRRIWRCGQACRARAGRVQPSTGRTRSRSTLTSGSSRGMTSAAYSCAGAMTCCRPSIAHRSTTARPVPRTSRCTGINTRSRGRAASAPSSSGSPGSRAAPRVSAG